MDIATAISDAVLVLNVGEKLVTLGMNAAPNIAMAVSILEGKTTLTAEQRVALVTEQTTYEQQIDAQVAADDAAGG